MRQPAIYNSNTLIQAADQPVKALLAAVMMRAVEDATGHARYDPAGKTRAEAHAWLRANAAHIFAVIAPPDRDPAQLAALLFEVHGLDTPRPAPLQ